MKRDIERIEGKKRGAAAVRRNEEGKIFAILLRTDG